MKLKVNRKLRGLAMLFWACFGAFAPSAALSETRAILAGVSHYQSEVIPDLAGPTNDLGAMQLLLRTHGANDLTVLSDTQVTRTSVESAIHDLGGRSKPGDWIVFYYTGHGAQSLAAVKSTRDGEFDQFLPLPGFDPQAPAPERYIVDKDFYEWFASYVPRDVNVLMIADTCHSGSLNRAPDPRAVHMQPRRSLADWSATMRLAARPGLRFDRILAVGNGARPSLREDLPNLIYVGAAQDGQFALEMPLPVEGKPSRGILTFALEQGLSRRGADEKTLLADLDADGRVTAGELSIYLDSQVRALSSQQQKPRTTFPSDREDLALFSNAGETSAVVEDRPLPQIRAIDETGFERLKGSGEPWIPIDASVAADFTWDYENGELLRRSGDLVAQNVLDTASLRGVVEKWNVFDSLRPLINEARTQLEVLPDGADVAYRPGQVVTVNLTARTTGAYATIFNLASDGTVQFLYPIDPDDGDGRLASKEIEGVIEARVVRPFGVDHVIAVTGPAPQLELQALLRSVDGQRASGRTIAPVRRALAAAPGKAGLSIVELFTQK